MLITNTEDLSRFCASLKGEEFVTVDTEFMRERTYYSKLCLVQLGGKAGAVAVDPLAEGIDLTPLYNLMADPSILKVFHAARQDVEIFVNATGVVPTPMFDTQVAAMVCGFGEAASYETLASKLARARIDKSNRFTDWARRPLTQAQTDYALADVTHLRIVYEKLKAELEKTGRGEWVSEEMAVLLNPGTYHIEPDEAWRRLKLRVDKPRARVVLRELAAWREREAQTHNVPRARIMKDDTLMEIALHAPNSAEELSHTRGLSQGFADSRQGQDILAAIAKALALPQDQWPEAEPRRILPNGTGAILDLLKVLLRQVSDEYGVAAKLIATTDELEKLATEEEPAIPVLQGWRRKLFGDQALALKKGELGLVIKGRKVVLVKV